eukprot:TRINITY_DN71536_c0_g1_i1.p1 TRINITY_DN71536_c0_g1~~TRINITY_DN71536_c0_g1_i1.p1  ORF type:complete len:286 (+),score=100.01 TRINITY_DN71536_c0_g1_i1:68-859(+)
MAARRSAAAAARACGALLGGPWRRPPALQGATRQRRLMGQASASYISAEQAMTELELTAKNFTLEELKEAYRRKVWAVHPDRRCGSPGGPALGSIANDPESLSGQSGLYKVNAAYAKLLETLRDRELARVQGAGQGVPGQRDFSNSSTVREAVRTAEMEAMEQLREETNDIRLKFVAYMVGSIVAVMLFLSAGITWAARDAKGVLDLRDWASGVRGSYAEFGLKESNPQVPMDGEKVGLWLSWQLQQIGKAEEPKRDQVAAAA